MEVVEKVVTVRYVKQWEELAGQKYAKFGFKKVVSTSTRRYHNCLYLLAGLNSSCRDLMDYLCEKMDKNNLVYSNEAVRESFIEFIKKITNGEVQYTHPTVKKAYNVLAGKGLLIARSRGTYVVNPEFFFRQGEKQRIEAIKMVLEFKD